MPDGIYLSNDTYAKLQGDLWAQDANNQVADTWAAQTTAALPDMVQGAADAEDRRQAAADAQAKAAQAQADAQAAQAQRDAAANTFESQANDLLAQHLGGAAPGTPSQTPPSAPQPVPAADTSGAPSTDAQATSSPAAPAPDVTGGAQAAADNGPLTPTSPVTAPLVAPLPSVSAPITAPLVPPAGVSQPANAQQPIPAVQPTTATTAELSGASQGSGRVTPQGQAILAGSTDIASWLGADGQKALQAVLVTEGGLNGARGDNGKSAGPLQFYEGGQLANFAQQHNMTLDQAKAYVEANPLEAIRWAIGTPDQPGYLGQAILAGQKAGLSGADLATYAQQHGQVSVSPERAGANWNALFANGQDPFSAATSGATRVVNAAVQNVVTNLRPSQFAVGLSDADAYAACGPVAALAFAKAMGRNPTAQEALDLAKQVGWTQGGGMAGPGSELQLLKNMGVPAHMDAGADPTKIASDVGNGNPVIISTTGHYFVADGVRQGPNGEQQFHVGTSGTDLKAGSEWMSLGDMQRVMGPVQASLFLDRQPGDGPSVAVQQQSTAASTAATTPTTTASTSASAATPFDPLKQIGDTISSAITSGLQNVFGGVQSPQTGNPLVDTAGTAASALGSVGHEAQVLTGGASPQFPSGGPLAGPLVGLGRQVAGDEQLQAENPEYGALANERDQIIAQLPPNATAIAMQGGPDADRIRALQDRYEEIRQRMSQIASQSDLFAAAQRNPNVQNYETQGALEQGVVAGALAPEGLASGVPRALASVAVDPGSAPFLGLQAAGDLARGVGHLLSPVASDVAAAADTPLSLTVRGGAQPAVAALPFATTLGGAAAGGGAALLATDPNDPNRIPKIVGGAAGGALVAANVSSLLERGVPSGPMTQIALPGFTGGQPATAGDIFKAYHSGNVISGAATLTHVAVNSFVVPAWSLATRGAADLLGAGVSVLPGVDMGNLGRVEGRGVAVASALSQMGEAFLGGLRDFYAAPGNVANRVDNPIVSGLLKAQQATGAALHASFQTMAQSTVTRMELGALAGEQAWNEGLRGQDLLTRISDLMDAPTPEMLAQAQDVGQRAALRGDAGTLQTLMQNIAKVPVLGNTLFPVVRIGSQALAQGVEKSPIGVLGTAADVARFGLAKARLAEPGTALAGPYAQTAADLAGGAGLQRIAGAVTPLTDRLTNNLAGSAVTMLLMQKASDGTITGNGPSDPRVRAMLQAQGWQPNSIYVTGRGYVDYHILGPLAVPLELAGAWHDATQYHKPGATATDIAGELAQNVAGYLSDATGLRTIGDLYTIMHGGGTAGDVAAQIAGSTLGGFVPESGALRSVATALDPNMRKPQPGNVQQVIQQGLPGGTPFIGGRTDLPVRQDVLGRPETNPEAGLATFLPRTGTGKPDPTLVLLGSAGIDLSASGPKTLNYAGKQLTLTSDEQQLRQQIYGQRIQQVLSHLVNSPTYQNLSDSAVNGNQQAQERLYRVLEPIVRSAGAYADQRTIMSIPTSDRHARLAAAPHQAAGGLMPYLPMPGGLAALLARQSAADADVAHQSLLQSMASRSVPLGQQGG